MTNLKTLDDSQEAQFIVASTRATVLCFEALPGKIALQIGTYQWTEAHLNPLMPELRMRADYGVIFIKAVSI